jgi:hypothetical protein
LDASNEDCDFRSGPVLPEIAHLYRTARWRVCKETSKIFKSAGIVYFAISRAFSYLYLLQKGLGFCLQTTLTPCEAIW